MIGVGAIGRPMAERILEAGIPLRVHDVDPAAVAALVARGAQGAGSPAEAAADADVVACMVRTDAQLLDAAIGERGALAAMARGSVFVAQSTVLPETIRRIGEAARPQGIGVVDAPVTGGVGGASAGTLVTMAGGEARDLERCRPVLEAMSRHIVHCGPSGTGMIAKLCNNLVGYMSYLASFEADQLARGAGLEAARLDEVLSNAGLLTDNMRAYLALARGEVELPPDALRELREHSAVLGDKDLAATLAAGRERGIELPASALCRARMPRIFGTDDLGEDTLRNETRRNEAGREDG